MPNPLRPTSTRMPIIDFEVNYHKDPNFKATIRLSQNASKLTINILPIKQNVRYFLYRCDLYILFPELA